MSSSAGAGCPAAMLTTTSPPIAHPPAGGHEFETERTPQALVNVGRTQRRRDRAGDLPVQALSLDTESLLRNQEVEAEPTPDVRREAARVALLSIGLAILLELLQLLLAGATGADCRPSTAARDTLLKLPWAVMVCLSLWLAITLAGDRPGTTAFVGLIAAPIASLFARSCAELAHAYTTAAAPSALPPPFLV